MDFGSLEWLGGGRGPWHFSFIFNCLNRVLVSLHDEVRYSSAFHPTVVVHPATTCTCTAWTVLARPSSMRMTDGR